MKKIFTAVGIVSEIEPNKSDDLVREFFHSFRVRLQSEHIQSIHDEVVPSFIEQGSRTRLKMNDGNWYHVKESFEECCEFWDHQSLDFVFKSN